MQTTKTPYSLCLLPLCLAIATLSFAAGSVAAAPVISPTGANYTGVSANSFYNGDYAPTKLFNFDVSSYSSGSTLPDGAEWATAGVLTGYVAFQLEASYSVSSLYFAPRDSGGRPDTDQMNLAYIWVSRSTAFDPNNPPLASADSFLVLTNSNGSRVWTEYPLSGSITGQYFLVEFIQTNGTCCNPGGTELRLGGSLPAAQPPTLLQVPASHTLYTGGTARFSVVADDGNTAPMYYRWYKGVTALSDSSRISGSSSPNLVVTSVDSGDVGSYSCTVTNNVGSTNSPAATLSLVPAPTNAVPALIISNKPLAYWRFEESTGATVAPDYFGGFDATYGLTSVLGNPGPRAPAFPGFSTSNNAVGTILNDAGSIVTAPALNLNSNAMTLIAWLNPADGQDQYASLIVWRPSSAFGLLAYQPAAGKPNTLSYIWNDFGWWEDSGLVLPTNEWCMAALVVTSTNNTLYLGWKGALKSYSSPNNNPVAAFNSSVLIGCDSYSRVFNGMIDDVAFFAQPLSSQQLLDIYSAGIGSVPVTITAQPRSHTLYVGGTARLSVEAGGTSPVYQWKKGSVALADGGNISGAHTPNLTIANVTGADAASYLCVVSNSFGPVNSDVAALTVIPAPTNSYNAAVLAYKPLAYWQLDQPSGAPLALDYWGGFDGMCLPHVALGVNGPQGPALPGFSTTNTGIQTVVYDGDSSIEVPALNLNDNHASIVMWVNPAASSQIGFTSMFASRSGGYMALCYNEAGDGLSYQWDSWGWNPGIAIPANQWSLIAMVITPTNSTVYLGNGGTLTNNTQVIDNPVFSFNGPSYIGSDSGNGTRVFDGVIDEVAFFNRSLSAADIQAIYRAALGQAPPPTTLNWSVTPSGLVLTWYGSWTLMQANAPTGPWTAATGIASGVPFPMNNAPKFFRLQH